MRTLEIVRDVLLRPRHCFRTLGKHGPEPHAYYWFVTTLPLCLRELWSFVREPAGDSVLRATSVLVWSSVVALASLYVIAFVTSVCLRWLGRNVDFPYMLRLVALSSTPMLLGFVDEVLLALWAWAAVLLVIAIRHGLRITSLRAALLPPALYLGPMLLLIAKQVFNLTAYKLPSNSMYPTLQSGDHVLVSGNLLSSQLPKRGAIIAFTKTSLENEGETGTEFLKRLMGLPGDVVENRKGRLYINGFALPRCPVGYLDTEDQVRLTLYVEFMDAEGYLVALDRTRVETDFGPFRLGPNEVFVLGDNRDNSYDSARWRAEGVSVSPSHIDGVVSFVWFPPRRMQGLSGIMSELPHTATPKLRAAFERCLARPPRETEVPAN